MAKTIYPCTSAPDGRKYFAVCVQSTGVKVGDALSYTRKDGTNLDGTAVAVISRTTSSTTVLFARSKPAHEQTKAELLAELEALRAQVGLGKAA